MAARQIPDLPGFNRFWLAWPANTPGGYDRKGGKSECLKLWAKGMEQIADEIIRHVEFMKTTRKWRETFGEYIPAPAVYLRQKRWDGANIPSTQVMPQVIPTGRIDRQLETAALMTGVKRRGPDVMGEVFDVGQRRIAE